MLAAALESEGRYNAVSLFVRMCICGGWFQGMSGYVHSHNTAAAAASPEYDGMLM